MSQKRRGFTVDPKMVYIVDGRVYSVKQLVKICRTRLLHLSKLIRDFPIEVAVQMPKKSNFFRPRLCPCGCGRMLNWYDQKWGHHTCRRKFIMAQIEAGEIKPAGLDKCKWCKKEMPYYDELVLLDGQKKMYCTKLCGINAYQKKKDEKRKIRKKQKDCSKGGIMCKRKAKWMNDGGGGSFKCRCTGYVPSYRRSESSNKEYDLKYI